MNKIYRKENLSDSITNIENHKVNDISVDNVLAISQEEIDKSIKGEVKEIENESSDVVDKMLSKPFNNLRIAIVVPVSGKYETIGNMIVNSALLNLSSTKYSNDIKLNVYDIGTLKEKNWKNNPEVQRLIKDNNDIIIGSVFEDTTKKLLSVIPTETQFISFINSNNLVKTYPNLTLVSADDSYKLLSLFEYLKDNNRKFLSLILPATKKGYNLDKLIKKIADNNEIVIMSVQFYQNNNKASILSAVKNTNRRFTTTFVIDENGKFITENIKQKQKRLKLEQNNGITEDRIDVLSLSTQQTKEFNADSVFIDGDENNLLMILSAMKNVGLTEKDIQIFSSAVLDTTKVLLYDFEMVHFIGYNYGFISSYNQVFKKSFGVMPNYFSYMTYDILSMINYLSNETNLKPSDWFNDDGFRGILDEFRFARDGNIERRMSIYAINNNNIFRKYTPDYYYNINGDKIAVENKYIQD